MATTEQITITVRDLHAASHATKDTPPTEEVAIAHTAGVILLVWREDNTPHQASIRDGEIIPE
jgi:hypothetical protein